MEGKAVPLLRVDLPKPRPWDLAAIAAVVAAGVLVALTFLLADAETPGAALSGMAATALVGGHLAVAVAGLALLGKTAKEGTLWGNLAATAAALAGLSGVLLVAAMWAAA